MLSNAHQLSVTHNRTILSHHGGILVNFPHCPSEFLEVDGVEHLSVSCKQIYQHLLQFPVVSNCFPLFIVVSCCFLLFPVVS